MLRLLSIASVILVATSTSAVLAQAPKPAIAKLPTIETFTLPNGLSVAVLPTDVAPVVAVQVWYHAGSKDEQRDRRGSAHMFEHMLFKGSHQFGTTDHAFRDQRLPNTSKRGFVLRDRTPPALAPSRRTGEQ